MANVQRLDTITESSGFDPLPPGAYRVKVEKVTEKAAGENAKHPNGGFFNIQFNVEGGTHAGRKLFMALSFHTGCTASNCDPSGLFGMLKTNLRALGFTDSQFAGELDLNEQTLLGREALATVGIRTNPNTNEPTNEIKSLKSLDAHTTLMP